MANRRHLIEREKLKGTASMVLIGSSDSVYGGKRLEGVIEFDSEYGFASKTVFRVTERYDGKTIGIFEYEDFDRAVDKYNSIEK